MTLPLKLAVLPLNSKLTVKLFVVVLLDTLTKLAVAKLPKSAFNEVILPLTPNVPVTFAPRVLTVNISAYPSTDTVTLLL